jgi:hypothetical protein
MAGCASHLSGIWHRVSTKTPKQLKEEIAHTLRFYRKSTWAYFHHTISPSIDNYADISTGSSLIFLSLGVVQIPNLKRRTKHSH